MSDHITEFASDTDLPDACFAYVPAGGSKSDRKLKLCDASGNLSPAIVGAAAAALSSGGFRGNRVQLPASARAGVIRKVRAAWRKCNAGKSDAEMPDSLKMSEDDDDEPVALYALRTGPATSEQLRTYLPVEFAEPPEWSPFLPVPGTYSHPTYGELTYTTDVYERMVANFKSGAYQDRLPVNAEHDPHAAGAIGWITDMRLSDSGAIEVRVDWNQRGRALLEGDRYRYVSAEVMPTWVDPVNPDQVYEDVAVGMAITTRPFFKTKVLPPLAASEAALTYAGDGVEDRMSDQDKDTKDVKDTEPVTTPATQEHSDKPAAAHAAERATMQMNEEVVAMFKEMERNLAEQGKKLVALSEENAALRKEGRVKEFTDEVKGRADDSHNPWIGDHDDHIAMLTDLAEQFGKDSKQVKQYIQVNRAQAEFAKTSHLFKKIGIGFRGETSASAQIDAAAKTLMASDKSLTHEKAVMVALKERPELYDAYQRGE